MRKPWCLLRLTLALLALSLAFACTSLLDLDSLKSKPPQGDGPRDAPQSGEQVQQPDLPPLIDYGRCVQGAPCQTGLKGICNYGKMRCFEGSTQGVCDTVTQPGTVKETCNGKDDDCDGSIDEGTCPLGMACYNANGKWECRCGSATGPVCTNGETCVSISSTAKACRCGANKINCDWDEICEGDACKCGDTTSTTGPACGAGSCVNNTCVIKTDAGPDKGEPDKRPPPDLPPPDLPVPDQPPPVQ